MSENQTNAPTVSAKTIEELMQRVAIQAAQINPTTVIAIGFLDGKFYLGSEIGACVSPENFNEDKGREIAIDKLFSTVEKRLWEFEGYRLYRSLEQSVPEETGSDQQEEASE